ncbi:hypothetical protein EVA_18618 [gut metagenome]|uniref:Uncharacterized protein n=1 Tax=gut metagenome TaxID=749906 RepID=J9G116_9ZZZZ
MIRAKSSSNAYTTHTLDVETAGNQYYFTATYTALAESWILCVK